jgi:DNA-binding response OmpR family regulator
MLSELLEGEGYTVVLAADGQRALHAGLSQSFDVLLLLDRELPAIEGLDILERLRDRGVAAPALILSGLSNPADRVEGLDRGAEDYMGKPLDVEELLARLRSLLRRHTTRAGSVRVPGGMLDVGGRTVTAGNGTVVVLSERGTVEVAGRSYAVLTAFHDGRVVQAAVDQRERQEEADRLMLALVVAGAAAAVLAAGASVWMARRAMRPLVESMALQRRFIADASHELRTPLTLLSTRAQLLRRRVTGPAAAPAPEEIAKGIEGIVEDSKRLTGILDDLLMAADPHGSADYTPVNLCAVGAGALAGGQAESQSLRLDTDFPAGPVTVRGSAVSLGRVFTALISSALDHANTAVRVTVSTRGRDAVIRVTDDGRGFAAGAEARAFERFASVRPEAPAAGRRGTTGSGSHSWPRSSHCTAEPCTWSRTRRRPGPRSWSPCRWPERSAACSAPAKTQSRGTALSKKTQRIREHY